MAYVFSYVILGSLLIALIAANEMFGLFSSDHFSALWKRVGAYLWLAAFCFLLTTLVISAAHEKVTKTALRDVSFWSLFTLHIILLIFLLGWWLLSGRPPIRKFMNLLPGDPLRSVSVGIAVGVGGWALTIMIAALIGLLLTALHLLPKDLAPSPMIPWMAGLSLWKKGIIVFTAMTVEEAFFRGFLQKRIGLVLSTMAFAIAHAGYGQPILLVGVTVVSVVIGYTFYRTKSLVPCIIAHGVFDAIQLFLIVPLAVKFAGV
ncbi:MAG: CPBP family intramembrane glutamic endopeptidase [Acidobacteriota bacterium]